MTLQSQEKNVFRRRDCEQYILMKTSALLCCLLLVACKTIDYTRNESKVCEVHQVVMFKRCVHFGHGMIPMSKVEAEQGEWKQRTDHYPHPGDCQPATGIVLPGQEGKVLVYVCPKCEAAFKAAQTAR
jgi:hypothetical protein